MRILLKVLLSILIVLAGAYDSCVISRAVGLPFSVGLLDRNTAVISPTPGMVLPAPLQEGDRIDLSRLDLETRTLLNLEYNGRTTPVGSYTLPFTRDGRAFEAQVSTAPLPATDVLLIVEAVSIV